jgi:perosamine synthetase
MIPISKPSITQLEIDYVTDAVKSTWVSSLGKYIDRFELEFAKFCQAKYGVALMNGTVAIQLALEACGVKEGHEVIVPDLSFIATANAVLNIGAIPVFADIDPIAFCLDPNRIEELITKKTKAIIPVHLYGHPANMPEIMAIAKKHNLMVIEDAAEAHGATIDGIPVGAWGDCATFSFYGNKNITTGEGGMITTNNLEIYEKSKFLRDHSMSKTKRYWHPEKGYNYRMTNLQAAIGCAQVERAQEILGQKNRIFNQYKLGLESYPIFELNVTSEGMTNSYWLITLRVKNMTEIDRDHFMKKLYENGVETRPFFYPMTMMPYLIQNQGNTPVSYQVYQEGINLPTFIDLTDDEIGKICETIISVYTKQS